MTLPQLSDWQAEHLRITAFAKNIDAGGHHAWWKLLAEGEPENLVNRAAQGIWSAEGPFDLGRLTVNIGPGRVDIIAAPGVNPDDPIPTLGAFSIVAPKFADAVKGWAVDTGLVISRIAFGSVVRYRVKGRKDGYEVLKELLPTVSIDPADDSTDLMYQVNRPRQSSSDEKLTLNRLARWNVIVLNLRELTSDTKTLEEFFCRVEIDINTAAEFTGDLRTAFDNCVTEMIDMANDLIKRGDQK